MGSTLQSTQFELSDTVQLDRADAAVLANIERVKALLADRQWDEAVETLRQISESADEKLFGLTDRRFISLREYCQLRLAALPPEALQLYRDRVDPLARKWYEEGIATRSRKLLLDVVEQAFASRWGDKALLALGEISLEEGDFTSARWFWERIIPAGAPADGTPTWPNFPDSKIDLAEVRARLVLVSILEGAATRAREELAQLVRLHGDARGRMGGQEVNYGEFLRTLLDQSALWRQPKRSSDWPTFAGSPQRNKVAARIVDPGQVAWRVSLPRVAHPVARPPVMLQSAQSVVLNTHPILAGDLVFVNDTHEIRAVRLATGQAAWGDADRVIFAGETDGAAAGGLAAELLGTAEFTLTALGSRLYARMGDPVTSRPQETRSGRGGGGYVVCLDLAAEGRLVWKLVPDNGWAFEGTPIADEANVYVAMRREGVRPQSYVACFEARTGRLRWRRFVCGAETPSRGMACEATHNLLTLHDKTVYFNTNLGAVAALRTDDGRIRWVSLYPRVLRGDLAKLSPHWQRELTPCVFDRGTLLVAPADSRRIFAIDAASGVILWQTAAELEDVVHLLGVAGDNLIASGNRLYWIGMGEEDRGRVRHVWPDGGEKLGYGRGVLAADGVLWPTRDHVYVFDQKTAAPRKIIDLKSRGVTGGNLLVADGRLLIASEKELVCLGNAAAAAANPHDVTRLDHKPETATEVP